VQRARSELELIWAAAALHSPQALASEAGRHRFLRHLAEEIPGLCSFTSTGATVAAFRWAPVVSGCLTSLNARSSQMAEDYDGSHKPACLRDER
jgi:hypothetical protein